MAKHTTIDKAAETAEHDHELIRAFLGSANWEEQLRVAREQREKIMAERALLSPAPSRKPESIARALRPDGGGAGGEISLPPGSASLPTISAVADPTDLPAEPVTGPLRADGLSESVAVPRPAAAAHSRPVALLGLGLAAGLVIGLVLSPGLGRLISSPTTPSATGGPAAFSDSPVLLTPEQPVWTANPQRAVMAPVPASLPVLSLMSPAARDLPARILSDPGSPPLVSAAITGLRPGAREEAAVSTPAVLTLDVPFRAMPAAAIGSLPDGAPTRSAPPRPVDALTEMLSQPRASPQSAAPLYPAALPPLVATARQAVPPTSSRDLEPVFGRWSPIPDVDALLVRLHVADGEIRSKALADLSEIGLVNAEPVPSQFPVAQTLVAYYREADAEAARAIARIFGGQSMDLTGITPAPAAGSLDLYLGHPPATAPD